MGIFASIEDKDGEPLEKVFGFYHLMPRFINAQNTICLQFITEFEDAAFNQRQLNILTKELNTLNAQNLNPEEKKELNQLLRLCEKIKGKDYCKIIFYGEKVPDF